MFTLIIHNGDGKGLIIASGRNIMLFNNILIISCLCLVITQIAIRHYLTGNIHINFILGTGQQITIHHSIVSGFTYHLIHIGAITALAFHHRNTLPVTAGTGIEGMIRGSL